VSALSRYTEPKAFTTLSDDLIDNVMWRQTGFSQFPECEQDKKNTGNNMRRPNTMTMAGIDVA